MRFFFFVVSFLVSFSSFAYEFSSDQIGRINRFVVDNLGDNVSQFQQVVVDDQSRVVSQIAVSVVEASARARMFVSLDMGSNQLKFSVKAVDAQFDALALSYEQRLNAAAASTPAQKVSMSRQAFTNTFNAILNNQDPNFLDMMLIYDVAQQIQGNLN